MKRGGFNIARRLAPYYGPHYGVAAQGVLRGLGLIYVLSFWSLAAQVIALSSPSGLQPVSLLLEYFREQAGDMAPLWFPSLVWISPSSLMLLALAGVGALAGLCMLFGFMPWLSALLSWLCWVSLLQVCQPWLSNPGDYLLAEMGLVGLLLVPPGCRFYPETLRTGSRITGILLLNAVLFKLLFRSGLSKLMLDDPSWADATAFFHFFETQSLPSSIAWYAHLLPEIVLTYGLWGMMFIELILVFYLFLPRTFRNILAGAVGVHSILLLATGHHGFLPLLMLVLAFSLVDDVSWRKALPEVWSPPAAISMYRPGFLSLLLLALLLPLTVWQSLGGQRDTVRSPWSLVEAGLGRVHAANRYALFSHVPAKRKELSIQGSVDGRQWVEYRFKLKPTDPRSIPHFSVLHLPRLDDQFTKLAQRIDPEKPATPPLWLIRLVERLMVNDPATLSLFPVNPFPDQPPNFIRIGVYDYRFADPVTRREEKTWWIREFKGFYGPVFRRES